MRMNQLSIDRVGHGRDPFTLSDHRGGTRPIDLVGHRFARNEGGRRSDDVTSAVISQVARDERWRFQSMYAPWLRTHPNRKRSASWRRAVSPRRASVQTTKNSNPPGPSFAALTT